MGNFYLPMEQSIYVPSTDATQRPITEAEMQRRVNAVDRFLSKKYGGFSSVKVQGGYVMTEGAEKGKLVKERVIKVTAFSTKPDFEKNKKDLFIQLEKWRKNWGQESIGYEIEGDLAYLTKSDKPIPSDLDELIKEKEKQNRQITAKEYKPKASHSSSNRKDNRVKLKTKSVSWG